AGLKNSDLLRAAEAGQIRRLAHRRSGHRTPTKPGRPNHGNHCLLREIKPPEKSIGACPRLPGADRIHSTGVKSLRSGRLSFTSCPAGHFMKKEYDFAKLKEVKNPYPSKKKAVGIKSCGSPRLQSGERCPRQRDVRARLANGLPYHKLI